MIGTGGITQMGKARFELELTVHAGPIERMDPVVEVTGLDLNNLLWNAGVDGHLDPFTLALTSAESADRLPVHHPGRGDARAGPVV
jgi:hypothetical protein